MVASDTVVGIVGAVVLVGVMAAVFVYEYNNPAEEGTDDGAADFAAHFPGLEADEDLDGDGMANVLDNDLDGDGTENNNDTDVGVVTAISGSRGQLLPGSTDAGQSFPLYVGTGNVHLEVTVTHASATPSPLPASPAFTFDVRNADGESLGAATASRTGSSVTLSFSLEESLDPGNYTIVVRQTSPGTGGSFMGSALLHYEAPVGLGDGHTH